MRQHIVVRSPRITRMFDCSIFAAVYAGPLPVFSTSLASRSTCKLLIFNGKTFRPEPTFAL